jgi:copper chaperone CopZ
MCIGVLWLIVELLIRKLKSIIKTITMKSITFRHTFILALFFIAAIGATAQGNKPVTAEFWVAGSCKDCKVRIEKALDVKGVLFADYSYKEHTLEITYKPHVISEDEILMLVAAAGHDTEKFKAPDDSYNKIDDCCKYRDHDCSKHK